MGKINLISSTDKKSPVAEAYRTIRTNIKFFSASKKLRTILCTSADAGEGKTTTAANLAVVMAQSGQKVLIIDCDMRNPSQHKVFSLHNNGLSNCLSSGEPADSYIQNTEVENVYVITAGPVPPNPSEMLGSETMSKLLAEVSEKYDYVILDAPPVLPVTDSLVLAPMSDGVILIICAGMVSPNEAKEVKERLQQAGTPILGIVMNKVELSRAYTYKY